MTGGGIARKTRSPGFNLWLGFDGESFTLTCPSLIRACILDRERPTELLQRKTSNRVSWLLSGISQENILSGLWNIYKMLRVLKPCNRCVVEAYRIRTILNNYDQENILSKSFSTCDSPISLARDISLIRSVLAVSSIFLSPKESSFSTLRINRSR